MFYSVSLRLEQSVSNIEKGREGTSKRYREFHIPWEWMLDTGLIGQVGDILLLIFVLKSYNIASHNS